MSLASQMPRDPMKAFCQGAFVNGGQTQVSAVRGEVLQNRLDAAVVLAGV